MTPLLGADTNQVELAGLVEQLLRCREVVDADRVTAERVAGPETNDPADLVVRERPVAERADGLADGEVLLLSSRLVDRDLAVAAGPLPFDELERVEALIGGRIDADRDAFARLADRLALLVDEPRLVLDHALRELNAGQALDLGQHAAENAGASESPSAVLTATFELMTASVALYESL